MIEEPSQPSPRISSQPPLRDSVCIDRGDTYAQFLRQAFSSQANYDQFINLASELAHTDMGLAPGKKRLETEPSHSREIVHKIALDGKRISPHKPISVDPSPLSARMKATIHLFEEAVENQNTMEQKRQFLRGVISHELSAAAKTALDFRNQLQNSLDKFNRNHVEPPASKDLLLSSLKDQFSKDRLDLFTDCVLDFKLLKTCFGHDDGEREEEPGSTIYNIVFDKSGKLIFSADQQGLIKVWSRDTGLVLYSFRGHVSYIEQILVAEGNKYLISSGPDGVRVWSLERFECVCSFNFENPQINMNTFYSEKEGLILCVSDSEYIYVIEEAVFKDWNGTNFPLSCILRKWLLPKNQTSTVLQITISPQGHCLVGLSSGEIILIHKGLFEDISDVKYVIINEHSKKCLDFSWSKSGRSFISCCMDGSCRIWDFTLGCFLQKSLTSSAQLGMTRHDRRKKKRDIICNSVAWSCRENYIIACFSEVNKPDEEQKMEGDILIYDYKRKRLLHEVRHKLFYKLEAVTIIEPHPVFENIAMFCQTSGRIVLFDIIKCQLINIFHERCFHLQYPTVVVEASEAKFSPDGAMIAVSTEYGSITLYGCGSRQMYFHCPTEQFFNSDRELFAVDDRMVPISLSADIDINQLNRYPLGDLKNNPHDFWYPNDLIKLAEDDFFNEELCAVPMTTNPNAGNPEWESMVQKQIQENLNKEMLLKPFYLSLEETGSSEIINQRTHVLNHQRQRLEERIFEFNTISTALNMSHISVNEQKAPEKRSRLKPAKQDRGVFLTRKRNQCNYNMQESEEHEFKQKDSESFKEESEPFPSDQEESEEIYSNLRRRRRPVLDSDSDGSEVLKARRPPAERIRELDEDFDEMQERRNRKKRLPPQEDEGIYGNGSRVRQLPIPPNKCGRCSKNVEETCEKCLVHGYCSTCKPLRGGEDLGKYVCFSCLFNKENYTEDREGVKRSHLNDTVRSNDVYIPQIDDEVIFFKQGYEEFLVKNHETLNPRATKIFDQFQLLAMDDMDIEESQQCRITDIEYMFPIKLRKRINSRNDTAERLKEINIVVEMVTPSGVTFQVFYIVDNVEFLVRRDIIQELKRISFEKKLQMHKVFQNKKGESLQIMDIQHSEKAYLWNSIKVSYAEERQVRRNGRQFKFNIWDIASEMTNIPFSSIEKTEADRILANISNIRNAKPELFSFFDDDVDTNVYVIYLQQVEVPMSIRVITERLKNGYYPSDKSLIFDIRAISKDSAQFNTESSHITHLADNLVDQLLKVVPPNSIVKPVEIQPQNPPVPMVEEGIDNSTMLLPSPSPPPLPLITRTRQANTQPRQSTRQRRATRNRDAHYNQMQMPEGVGSVGVLRRSTRRSGLN